MHLARRLLCQMQLHIRDAVISARRRTKASSLSKIAAVTASDTIYQVDRVSEDAICEWFAQHWPAKWPVELVMEGLEDRPEPVCFPLGTPVSKTLFRCIIDPIDGTRNLMYDKRSAWVLSALAPQRGARTKLRDITVCAMTEIPTTKQWRSDQFSAVRGGKLVSTAFDVLRGGPGKRFAPQPSPAHDYKHGFASIVRFFPEGKALLSQLEEELWSEIHGLGTGRSPLVFDDQYISTGGQIAELLVGHDRMIADLRPLAFAKLGLPGELVCHPYDICTSFLLQCAGGIIEKPDGRPLDAPLDTISPVAWVGYANPFLARKTRPILRRLCQKHLG